MTTKTTSYTSRMLPCLLGLLWPLMGHANLDIAPLRTEIAGKPGSELVGELTLFNLNPHPTRYEVTTENTDRSRIGVDSWLRMPTNSLLLQPNETYRLAYSVRIPAQAEGELLGRIGFSEVPLVSGSVVDIRTKLSVSVHVVVEGTDIYQAAIRHVRIPSTAPLNIEVDVENTGNVLLHPSGHCHLIQKPSGRPVLSLAMNENNTPLYTGVTRTFAIKTKEQLAPGTYEVRIRMEPALNEPFVDFTKTLFVPDERLKSDPNQ